MSALDNNNNNNLSLVVENLGVEDAIELFEYALPRVLDRKSQIIKHMQSQNWDAARDDAHRAISSVRIYGTERLETLLRQVKMASTGEVDSQVLQQELSDEFDHVVQAIAGWLQENSTS